MNKEALAIALNNPLSNAELADFFNNMDQYQSSSITWDEFISYWKDIEVQK